MKEIFEQFYASFTDPVTIVDKDYVYRYANQAYLESQGFAREDIVGKTIGRVAGKERFDAIKPHIDAALSGETSHHIFQSKASHPSIQFLEVVHRRFRAPDNNWMIFSITHDCTQAVLAQKNLQLISEVISSSSDMICIVNESYEYVMANRMYLEVVGKDRDQVIGKRISDVMEAEAFDRVFKPALDAAFRGEPARTQIARDWAKIGRTAGLPRIASQQG